MSRSHLSVVIRHAEAIAASHPGAHTPGSPTDADLLRRFAEDRDDAAFAALVARHGPMVWGVCRNLLAADADAEDAFQATFLALVRSADRVRDGDRLAGWLHGVAVRVALKARRAAAHRRRRERAAAGSEAEIAPAIPGPAWDGLLAAVHEEVQRLPEALRTAFVMCGLEGVRQQDAAARLGWKPGTLTARLTRARQKLLAGLARRGIAPAAAAGAVAVGAAPAPADLTARVAGLARDPGWITPSILNLSQGVIEMSARTKWLAAALLAAAGLASMVGTAVVAQQGPQRPGDPDRGRAGRDERGGRGADQPGTAQRGSSGGGFGGAIGGLMPRGWEYKVVDIPLDGRGTRLEEQLNKLGAEGWELCLKGDRDAVVFKRPKISMPPGGVGGAFGGMMGGGGFGPAPAGGGNPFAGGGDAGGGDAGGPPRRGTGGQFGGFARGGSGGGGGGAADFLVIPLRNAEAAELARLLSEVYGSTSGVRINADPRTNRLLVYSSPETHKTIQALVEKLDVPGEPPPTRKR